MRHILILSLMSTLLVHSARSQAAPVVRADFYSEQSYLSREGRLGGVARMRGEIGFETLRAYLTAGLEGANLLRTDMSATSETFTYAGPGLRLDLGRFSLFGEWRVRDFLEKQGQPLTDGRGLLTYGDLWEGNRWAPAARPFLEPYGEVVATSADDWNLIGATFVRAGLRAALSQRTWFDLMIEPFVTLDRHGHFYNNRFEARAGARIATTWNSMAMSLTGSLLAIKYFDRSLEPNPYLHQTWGARVLGVVSGIW